MRRSILLVFLSIALSCTAVAEEAADADWEACESDDYGKALPACTRVLGDKALSSADRASIYYNRGRAFRAKGDRERAIADFSEAISLNPDDAYAYHARGGCYSEDGDQDRAIADYSEAIRLKPDAAEPFNNRGNSYAAKGEEDLAIADYSEAIKVKPDLAEAYFHRGLAYARKGDRVRAAVDYHDAIRLKPTLSATTERAKNKLEALLAEPAGSSTAVAASEAPALRRIALVVANGNYTTGAVSVLTNPANDASAVAEALRGAGFEVGEVRSDVGRAELVDILGDFEARANDADWALVYYAGHGLEMDGEAYLLPTDFVDGSKNQIRDRAYPLVSIIEHLQGAGKVRMVVYDACRDNPIQRRLAALATRSSFDRGSAVRTRGDVVLYSASKSQTAADGPPGALSPFAEAFVAELASPGLDIGEVFDHVEQRVARQTKGAQRPDVKGLPISGKYYFNPAVTTGSK